jgi:hypothetical protein
MYRLIRRMKIEEHGMFGTGLLISSALHTKRALRSRLVLFSNEEAADKWKTTDADSALQPR